MDDIDFLSSTIDLDFDFDLGDFEVLTEDQPDHEVTRQRILKPRIDMKAIDTRLVNYDNARQFVKDLDLMNNSRVYAWLDGSFIFGEIPEALGEIGHPVRKAWITSLGLSEENVDSFYNCFMLYGLEKLCLLLSGYYYRHEKFKIIPYMLDKLDMEIETEAGQMGAMLSGWLFQYARENHVPRADGRNEANHPRQQQPAQFQQRGADHSGNRPGVIRFQRSNYPRIHAEVLHDKPQRR